MSEEMVPRARLDAALAKQAELAAKLEAATQHTSELTDRLRAAESDAQARAQRIQEIESDAGSAASLAQRLQEVEAELQAERQAREQDGLISRAGFVDHDLVRFEFGRQRDTDDFVEWLEKLRADEDAMPATLRAALPRVAQSASPSVSTRGTTSQSGRAAAETPSAQPASKNERLKQIAHPVGSPEWRVAAQAILDGQDPQG